MCSEVPNSRAVPAIAVWDVPREGVNGLLNEFKIKVPDQLDEGVSTHLGVNAASETLHSPEGSTDMVLQLNVLHRRSDSVMGLRQVPDAIGFECTGSGSCAPET